MAAANVVALSLQKRGNWERKIRLHLPRRRGRVTQGRWGRGSLSHHFLLGTTCFRLLPLSSFSRHKLIFIIIIINIIIFLQEQCFLWMEYREWCRRRTLVGLGVFGVLFGFFLVFVFRFLGLFIFLLNAGFYGDCFEVMR